MSKTMQPEKSNKSAKQLLSGATSKKQIEESSGQSQNTFSIGSSKANINVDPLDSEPVDKRSENTKRREECGSRI